MTALPFPTPDPRQAEYERLLAEFTDAQEGVLAREIELDELERTLHAFECYYLGRVRHLHALLDALEVESLEIWIAHLQATASDAAGRYEQLVHDARARARESANSIPMDAPETFERPVRSADTTRLYREVARSIHPDLASDETQARIRHSFMSELNVAYREGDAVRMQAVLDTWNATAVAPSEDLDEALLRVARQLARARNRLQELEVNVTGLRESELHELLLRAADAEARGRDLVQELVEDLERQIEEARLDQARIRERVA